ncbi:diaminopimelate epimerase [Candidatus Woesearchaeota archaeon]|nr:diaminopimelate epimerase [Candidatus Woesearchaeota archaeon]
MKFTKLHGAGNDYLYIDLTTNYYNFDPSELSRRMSDRHFGVGADGIILVMNRTTRETDFRMRIFNADGSEAEMCGNGIRAFAKFLVDSKLTDKRRLRIETGAGVREVEMLGSMGRTAYVRVDMGAPVLDASLIPVAAGKSPVLDNELSVGGQVFRFSAVSMGNPHCVILADELTDELVKGFGPKIEAHELFPKHTNVEFVKVRNSGEVDMRVWERGSGETLACGTGASAVAVACSLNGRTGRKVKVNVLGGVLEIEWAQGNHVFMTGPAETVFEGVYDYEQAMGTFK